MVVNILVVKSLKHLIILSLYHVTWRATYLIHDDIILCVCVCVSIYIKHLKWTMHFTR